MSAPFKPSAPPLVRALRGEPRPTDWNDPQARRDWLHALREQLDEMNGIAEDMMKPLRQRDFGLVQHRKMFDDAYESAVAAVDYIETKLLPDPEGGEPTR